MSAKTAKSGETSNSRDRAKSGDIIFKIIIVGNAGVGKSCLLNRFTKKTFLTDYNATIGVEFQSQIVQIDAETKIRLQIWDTCGQESFQSIVRSFYRNSAAVFIVFSIADQASFESINQWYEEAQGQALDSSVYVLVGAQKDRESERQVSEQQAQDFMKEKNMHLFFETSAVDGTNIEKAFQEAGKLIFFNYIQEQMKQKKSDNEETQNPKAKKLNSKESKKKKKDGCC